MKGIFVILGGVADEPLSSLGMVTPLEEARTPNLDWFSSKSEMSHCYPIKKGIVPKSSKSIVSLLGKDPLDISEGVLDAIGSGISLKRGDLAFRCNFATVEDLDTRNILDRRAGRTLDMKESKILEDSINTEVKLPFDFEFRSTNQHRGVLVFKGGFSENITDIDSFYDLKYKDLGISEKFSFSNPQDNEDDSKLSADLVNGFVKKSHEILDSHVLNRDRARKGLFSANFILCRGSGIRSGTFKKLKGRWMGLGGNSLDRGIIKFCKMDSYSFAYPSMKGIDAYKNLYDCLYKSIKNSIKMLKRNWKKYDYFYIHFAELGIPGLDNKPFDKIKMIEILDKKFFSFLRGFLEKKDVKMVLTSDQTVSSRLKRPIENPVPVLFYNSNDLKEFERRFIEREGLKGKRIIGNKLLEKTLFVK